MHLLYVSMTRKEQNMGLGLLVLMFLSILIFPARTAPLEAFLFYGGYFLAVLVIFRQFLRSSLEVPLIPFATVLKFTLLGYALAFLANLLTNDLIYYFLPKYFYYNETGPHFVNLCKIHMGALASVNFPLTAVVVVLFVPLVEELLYLGVVFGNLLQKNHPLAYVISTLLYCLVLTAPILGQYPADYVILSFIQYIPINLMFCWIYTRTETVLTPILAHMVMNGISIFTMR